MAWDTEGTKRKIKDAATVEFTRRGPAGTTVERIAKRAGVNKERVYNYFGSKDRLFSAVLRDELTRAAEAVPPAFDDGEDAGDYAGRLYDYHRQRPELIRLLCWEALTFDDEVPEEEPGLRRPHPGHRPGGAHGHAHVADRLVVHRASGGPDAVRAPRG